MLAITTPDGVNDEDTRMWPIGKHDIFFVTSTYNMMGNYPYTNDDSSWNKIWCLNTPERARYFVPLLRHERQS